MDINRSIWATDNFERVNMKTQPDATVFTLIQNQRGPYYNWYMEFLDYDELPKAEFRK